MSSALDKSLDDMIKAKPRPQRRRRVPSAKAAIVGSGNTGAAAAAKAANRAAALTAPAKPAEPTATQAQQETRKIVISNLPADVTEQQIKELFNATIGKTREVSLAFDAKGKSKGICHVTFTNKGDGFKAYKEYNGRLIDAKSQMKIELILEPVKAAPPSLASRVAPPPKAPAAPRAAATNGAAPATRGAVRGRGGRGRGRGGRARRPAKSAADLDQEMEEYAAAPATETKAAPAAAAPAA